MPQGGGIRNDKHSSLKGHFQTWHHVAWPEARAVEVGGLWGPASEDREGKDTPGCEEELGNKGHWESSLHEDTTAGIAASGKVSYSPS